MTNNELEIYFENAIMNGSDENLPTGSFHLDVVITDDEVSVVVVNAMED